MNRARLLWGAFQTTLTYISARSEPAGRPALTERSQFSFGQAPERFRGGSLSTVPGRREKVQNFM